MIEGKNGAYAAYLRSNTKAKKKKLKQHQRTVKKTIDKAKEEWVWQVATLGGKAAKAGPTK